MQKYLCEFFEKFSYPEEASIDLMRAYNQICEEKGLKQQFESILHNYENDMKYSYFKILPSLYDEFSKVDIHEYTGAFILLVCMTKSLREHYRRAGLDEKIWLVSVSDLKWKLMECKCVYNIYGTSNEEWFIPLFSMTRFGFGKLQFEKMTFGESLQMEGLSQDIRYQKKGVVLEPNTWIVNVHIPRTGMKLDRESKEMSYKEAALFYKDIAQYGKVLFVCHSWLLYPPNKEVLSPDSNLYRFISDYDVFTEDTYKDYSEVWRLFDVNYNGDVDQLPQDTSFRRAYVDWIRKGKKTGWGYGVFPYPV